MIPPEESIMTKNEFNLLYTIQKNGIQSYRKMKENANVSTGFISRTMKFIEEMGADWSKYIPKEFKDEEID